MCALEGHLMQMYVFMQFMHRDNKQHAARGMSFSFYMYLAGCNLVLQPLQPALQPIVETYLDN